MPPLNSKRPGSILGLCLDGDRLDGVVLRRTNGSAEPGAEVSVDLSLKPLSHDPELAGREIRERLDAAEIRERRCAVSLPLGWALCHSFRMPALPEEDVPGFLQLEAERGFSTDPSTLILSSHRLPLPGTTDQHVVQVGFPLEHLQRMESVLRAARLTPVCFSLSLPALQAAEGASASGPGVAAIEVIENRIGLLVTAAGGLVALRTLDAAIEDEGAERRINAAVVLRELRITLGQLSPELRTGVTLLRIYGTGGLADRLADELRPRVDSLGLQVERIARVVPGQLPLGLPPGARLTGPLALATRYLSGAPGLMDFLPPRVSPWQRITGRYSARKLVYAGGALAFLLLLTGGAFLVQQVQLSRLRGEWASMAPRVRELEILQQEIKQFRPWFDESFRSLTLLKRLTESFPEEGSVTAKSVEIRDASTVTCTGTARDSQALYKVLDQLRAASEITDVQVDTVRGKSPLQFSFNFHFGERTQP
ncbi:MAG TPA: hypothetical protein DCM86_03520 [Verrucomicrobiales bacterium]|nr:hypothetical protein [Verrucomicrobiales bacterium]